MQTPEIGHVYFVKHSSGMIQAKFIREIVYNPIFRPSVYSGMAQRRSTTHYLFLNLHSGREIEIKSRVKIRREVRLEEYCNHLVK